MAQTVALTWAAHAAAGVQQLPASPGGDATCVRWPGMVHQVERGADDTSAVTYEIQIREYLDSDWADWLGGMALTHTDEGATLLRGAAGPGGAVRRVDEPARSGADADRGAACRIGCRVRQKTR